MSIPSITFSFNQSQDLNQGYHPSSQEIKKFKANNKNLSKIFKNKSKEFKKIINKEKK